MKRLTLSAVLLFAAFTASATCSVTSRGPVCPKPADCSTAQVWNPILQECILASCPPGAVVGHLDGGGVTCKNDLPVCLPGYVWRMDLGRCDYPIASTRDCVMVVSWSSVDPQNAKPDEVPGTPACTDSMDIASARILIQLLGGR